MTIKPTGDICYIKLAPPQTHAGAILVASSAVVTYGKVMACGPKVTDVQPGDVVAFSNEVGDSAPGSTPHLFIRESQIDAIVPKREAIGAA